SFCKWHKIVLMTTRAGAAGLLTGLITTIIIYPFFMTWPEAFLQRLAAGPARPVWIAASLFMVLMTGGGFWAGWWSGSSHPGRCVALGALAGGLAGIILFCLWGAATAGCARWVLPLDRVANGTISQVEALSAIVRQTLGVFLLLFLGGSGLGAFGGWLACLRRPKRVDVFDKDAPQMAMNASITAVPAPIVAAALAAGIISRLSELLGGQTGQPVFDGTLVELPLAVSLLLVLISQSALTLVIPHEAQQAEHRSGMDEVKMGAYVGIGAAPLLILLLFLIDANSFSNPLVLTALLASAVLSLISLHTLFKRILPARAAFPAPRSGRQKTEAKLFGTIAVSRGPRLVALCIGCGLAMILPLYVSVASVLINLKHTLTGSAFSQPLPEVTWRLYLTQALVSTGIVTAAIVLLIIMYLFYLNLGRWFSNRNKLHQ
ncbi:MAG: hypothetical protein WBV22_03710, partial [Anaerolineaceae bacterium]